MNCCQRVLAVNVAILRIASTSRIHLTSLRSMGQFWRAQVSKLVAAGYFLGAPTFRVVPSSTFRSPWIYIYIVLYCAVCLQVQGLRGLREVWGDRVAFRKRKKQNTKQLLEMTQQKTKRTNTTDQRHKTSTIKPWGSLLHHVS